MKYLAMLPLAALSLALAQSPPRAAAPGRVGGLAELKAYLNLDDAQIQQMNQARRQALQDARPVATQLAQAQRELREMLQSPNPDPAAVGKKTLEVKSLREQLRTSRQAVTQAVLNVLTADQRTKLANLEEAAKLAPAARQAMLLGLIERPERPAQRIGPARRGVGARAFRRFRSL